MPISTNDGQYFENEAEFLLADNIPLESPRKPTGASKSESGNVPLPRSAPKPKDYSSPKTWLDDLPYDIKRQMGEEILKRGLLKESGVDVYTTGPYNDTKTREQELREWDQGKTSKGVLKLFEEEFEKDSKDPDYSYQTEMPFIQRKASAGSDTLVGDPGADDLSSPPAKRSIWDQLTGADGGERFQTFPERAVRETLENIRTFMTTEPGSEENIQASARVGFDLGLGGLVTAPMRTGAGMFGGILGAAGSPKVSELMLKASEMAAKNANPADIYRKTGVYMGPDQKLRFEFSDHTAKIKNLEKVPLEDVADVSWTSFNTRTGDHFMKIPEEGTTLGKILDHPVLYYLYPGSEKIKILPLKDKPGSITKASYFPEKNEIHIGKMTEDSLSSVLLHEVQHYIQDLEGHATGSSPSNEASKNFKEYVPIRLFEPLLERTIDSRLKKEFPNTLEGDKEQLLSIIEKEVHKGPLEDFEKNALNKTREILPKFYEAAKTYMQAKNALRKAEKDSYADYARVFGEVESRLTQQRKDYTSAERRSVPPWDSSVMSEAYPTNVIPERAIILE